ncbi:MAG: hypothetical protein M3370_12945 [Actinomycetota bacterium]|nr:hypothetical protein [Actinomycetota bacterium]
MVDQEPEAGGEVDEYGAVRVRCKARVPKLVGKKADTAESRLMDAGFESRLFNEPADYDLSRCRVRSQKPTGRAAPYATVRLTLNCKEPPPEPELAPEPEPADDCDPNYSGGCVPVYPPDVDCPDVDGEVAVTGDDVHALDRENDGSACE